MCTFAYRECKFLRPLSNIRAFTAEGKEYYHGLLRQKKAQITYGIIMGFRVRQRHPIHGANPRGNQPYMGLVSREDSSPRYFQGEMPASGDPVV